MEAAIQQQIADYINRSRKILLALPLHVTVDRLCSAYALSRILQKLGKETTIASAARMLPNTDFLPDMPSVTPVLNTGQSLVINVSTARTQLDELSYQSTLPDQVQIFLKAKDQGQFLPEDVTVGAAAENFDLVIVLGTQTLEDLGDLYLQNTDLFFNTPKINLDIDASNDYFGTINWVDVTASAVSEVVTQIIASLEAAVTDENVATSLLGGIIANTHSFQDAVTTPKTLNTASSLIAQGARQQDIIKSLYKTKDFSLLKLWGRALARIKTVSDVSLLYSTLTRSDFERSGEDNDRLMLVLRELLENVSGFQVVALLGEQDNPKGVRFLIAGLPHANITNIARKLNQEAVHAIPLLGLYQVVVVDIPGLTPAEAEQRLLKAVRE
jgi:nanoRNase/pAp phosphatase (c-di-AMP/oligoRNAs hydrolase)